MTPKKILSKNVLAGCVCKAQCVQPSFTKKFRLALLPVLFFLLTGCKISRPMGGEVFVGQPQVLSRESTIRERQRDKEWLKDQLKPENMLEESVQGFIETEL